MNNILRNQLILHGFISKYGADLLLDDIADAVLSVYWWRLAVSDCSHLADFGHLVQVDLLVDCHDCLQNIILKQSCFVFGIQFECTLELVLRGGVIADGPHDEAPDDPVVGVVGVVDDSLLNFLNSLSHLSFFIKGKRPVAEAEMVDIGVIELGLRANVDCFWV